MPTAKRARRPRRSIAELMAAYKAQLPVSRREADRTEQSLDLLRRALNGYGHQYLSRADADRFQTAYNDGNEDAFCEMFGARELVKYLDEFLGDFMIRKVLFPEAEVARVIEDARGFVSWLATQRELTPKAATGALGRIARAAVDIPAAERLSKVFYDMAKAAMQRARRGAPPQIDEEIDDYLVIERVAPGRIWFIGVDEPLKVPEAASAIARPGWTANLVLGRIGGQWTVLESGNVYPETIA